VLDAIARLPIPTANRFAALGDLADLELEDEPLVIEREAN